MRADIGIALDGDADRVMIVDERGHVVDGDQLLAVIAESWKEDGRLPSPGVVATVMSNLGLERHLAGARHRTGPHRRSATATCSSTCARTATMSAASRPATSSCPTTPRPATASSPRLQVLAVVKRSDKPVSEVCHRFEPLPQVLKNVRYQKRQAARERRACARPSPAPRRSSAAAAADRAALRHRAGDPRDGRRRRQGAGRGGRRRRRRGADGRSRLSSPRRPAAIRKSISLIRAILCRRPTSPALPCNFIGTVSLKNVVKKQG